MQIGLKPKQILDQRYIDNFYKKRVISTVDFYDGTPCSYSKLNDDPHNKYSLITNNLQKNMSRHKFSYILHHNKLPSFGYHIHHKCGHHGCDNELHLEAVTPPEHGDITMEKLYENHTYQTKEEREIYGKKYYQEKKEKIKVNARKYRQENKEKIKVNARKYRQENKEKLNADGKKYYQKKKAEKERLAKNKEI